MPRIARARDSKLTKRAAVPFGTEGGAGSLTASVDFVSRALMPPLPKTTTRVRLKVANYNSSTLGAKTAAYNFAGAAIGTPAWSAASRWGGAFAAAGTSLLPAGGAIPTDGTDLVTGWVTDPTLIARMTSGLWGLSVAASKVSNGSMEQSAYKGITFITPVSGLADSGTPGGAAKSDFSLCDWRLEYEFTTYADEREILTGVFIGDSITGGSFDSVLDGMPFEQWPNAAAQMSRRYVAINAGIHNSTAQQWGTANNRRWTRFDLSTVVPDFAVILLGSNDINNGSTDVNVKGYLDFVIANVKALGIPRVGLCTIIPRSFAATPEGYRTSVNNGYIRQLASGAQFVWDMDKAVATPGTPATPDVDLFPTAVHPNPGGAQRMASVARI